MNLDDVLKIKDDLTRNEELYKIFDESKRLSSKAGQVEKVTTLHYLKTIVRSTDKVLDVGAATGVYTISLAEMVNEVVAIEPSLRNYEQLVDNTKELSNVKCVNGSSFDLKRFHDEEFDGVLLLGPLYHLSKKKDQLQTLKEAKRICKKSGMIMIAFINHDMIPMTETSYNAQYFESAIFDNLYDSTTQRVTNIPFIFFRLDECRELMKEAELKIETEIAVDGFAEILADKINEMSEGAYKNYLSWHLSHCETSELLGATNHFLFICKKQERK